MSRAIRKYGWDNLVITILQECRTKTDANRIETDFIQLFRSYDRQRGYNIKQFVDGRGRNKLSRSHKRKISMGHLGKKHSKETKEKISKSWINRTVSEETKRKMSITHTRINKLNRKYNGKN
jgi:group I intron endonuclease